MPIRRGFIVSVFCVAMLLGVSLASAATLAGWNVSGVTAYGPSPLAATTSDPNVTVGGLARGAGVGTSGTGAQRAWGGNTFTSGTAPAAAAANQFATCVVTANAGYSVSFSAISRFDYRRSGTGPNAGVLQYQVGAGAFTDVTTLNYASSNSSGASLGAITLSNIAALQNVASGTAVTFRIVNYGGTNSGGTWYIFDVANSSAADFEIQGTVAPSGPVPPALASSTPPHGAVNVPTASTIAVNFNQPVTVSGTWFTLVGSISGGITANTSGSSANYTLTPAAPFANSETVMLTILASQVTNAGGDPMASNATVSFTTAPPPGSSTPIHTVQGSGLSSPLAGGTVTIEGVVVGDFQGTSPAFGGFYVQEQDTEADADPATSEGVFVFDRGSPGSVDVVVGDVVSVSGTVQEFSGLTELINITLINKLGSSALPTATVVTLPAASASGLERYEGMRVSFTQELTVCDNHLLGQYGELILASGGLLRQPTEDTDPNDNPASGTNSSGTSNLAAVLAETDSNLRRSIVLDDSSTATYPDPTPFLGAAQTRRAGDTVLGLAGILTFGFDDYRIQPTGPVTFASGNPRTATPPAIPGRLKVAGYNVLNYFTTFGSRGANNAAEFSRQQTKLVAALTAINADVVGLVEIENNSVTAVDNLVTALNAVLGAGTYTRVNEPAAGSGSDAIRVALIYKPATVSAVGQSVSEANAIWNRPPLAQLFAENLTGERFIACVNHFKSKSGSGATGADADQGDGQSAYNDRRKQQAVRLVSFLNTFRTAAGEQDVVLLGDYNGYAQEDPIDILRAGGYADQTLIHAPGSYSYLFDGRSGRLDYALASTSMTPQIVGLANWHINSPEPLYLDYNTENKSAAQQAINTGTPYRSSDHDPVVVGVSLTTTYASWAATIAWPPGADTTPNGDPDGDGLRNLEELFYHSQPTVRDAHLRPTFTLEGGSLLFDFRVRTNLIDYTIVPQWSPDLFTWFDLTDTEIEASIDPITNLYRSILSITDPEPDLDRAFLRLEFRPLF